MPITLRPGTVATRADTALIDRAMSSARPMTRLGLVPGAGSSSIERDHRAGPDLDDLARRRNPRAPSRAGATTSDSCALVRLIPLLVFGRASRSSTGSSNGVEGSRRAGWPSARAVPAAARSRPVAGFRPRSAAGASAASSAIRRAWPPAPRRAPFDAASPAGPRHGPRPGDATAAASPRDRARPARLDRRPRLAVLVGAGATITQVAPAFRHHAPALGAGHQGDAPDIAAEPMRPAGDAIGEPQGFPPAQPDRGDDEQQGQTPLPQT